MMNNSWWKKYDMLPAGCRVLAAVSGGADSMCMLRMLCDLRPEITVIAAHFEHGIRGAESERDCAFTQEQCRLLGVQCIVGHGDVPTAAAASGKSLEETARNLRYTFLEETADACGCDRIATAHNANDNAETVLFHLARGSGTAGLCGIPPVRGRIIRPILNLTRDEIERYLAENDIPHVEDSTNALDDCTRNRIRHEVIPAMESIRSGFVKNTAAASELLREDENYLSGLAVRFMETECSGGRVNAGKLLALPKPVRSRVVRLLCGPGTGREHTEAVLDFAAGTEAALLDVPGMRIRRERGVLYFGDGDHPVLPDREIVPGTVTEIPETELRIWAEYLPRRTEINSEFKTYDFNCERISGKIFCTGRRPGDSFRPSGRGCTKTLKKLFLEAGLTGPERDLVPVFRDDKGILAVHGFGVAERCAAAPGDSVLRITVEKTGENKNGKSGE